MIQDARDAHFAAHPWQLGDDPQTFPRYPSMSDDQQVSTGVAATIQVPAQGATIFGDANPAQGATLFGGATPAVAEAAQAILNSQTVQLTHGTSTPFVFPAMSAQDATPTQWHIYNRWTGKYVSDEHGSEDSNQGRAFPFPTEAAARQFAAQTQGTPLATALAQPPPDDPPDCETCWRVQARGATQCLHCGSAITSTRSWAYAFPYDAAGRTTSGSVAL